MTENEFFMYLIYAMWGFVILTAIAAARVIYKMVKDPSSVIERKK
jgi:hypothetical protein